VGTRVSKEADDVYKKKEGVNLRENGILIRNAGGREGEKEKGSVRIELMKGKLELKRKHRRRQTTMSL